jgi:hypothetical protein
MIALAGACPPWLKGIVKIAGNGKIPVDAAKEVSVLWAKAIDAVSAARSGGVRPVKNAPRRKTRPKNSFATPPPLRASLSGQDLLGGAAAGTFP